MTGLDSDGERYIPLNDVLSYYGYSSRESQLFPKKTPFQIFQRTAKTVFNVFSPNLPVEASLAFEWIQGGVEMNNIFNYDIKDANFNNVLKFKKNLLNIEDLLKTKILNIENIIKDLKAKDKIDLYGAEIISQTNYKLELEDRLIPIQLELGDVNKIISNKTYE